MADVWNDAKLEALVERLHHDSKTFRLEHWWPILAAGVVLYGLYFFFEFLDPIPAFGIFMFYVGVGSGERGARREIVRNLEVDCVEKGYTP
ncbi:MAG: hypothetical protein ACPG31_05830 [Planctomycetota bacterium]